MKLATLKNGTRDGRLVVVASDLTRCSGLELVPTLQAALDDWATISPILNDLQKQLDVERLDGEMFSQSACHSPLPRAYQWADGSAYVNHFELVRKARGAKMPETFWTDPLMYQGGSDSFLDPYGDIELADEAWGIDFEAEVAVITDDVPMGVSPADARR
ncbi:MAG: fumarylacetoacetate hydrolase family protein, partial [Aestuariivirgaceae bacterium]